MGAVGQLSVDHADPHPVDGGQAMLAAPDGRRLVPVLTYHAVSDDPPEPIRRWSVSPARLRAHLSALRQAGFTGLTVTELLACYRGERTLPEKPVVLTFDDGYEDFLLEALPALDDSGFRSTLYASSGLLRDEPSVAVRPGRMLDWRQLGEVAQAGVEIGAHSHTHRELDTLSRREAAWEVTHSGQRLRDELGLPVDTFAYPYGYSNRHVRAAVEAAGYVAACGVKNAYSHADDDRWALSRILVERDFDTAALTRLVTRPVLPVGWRREKPQTIAWRTYRRARALATAARGGTTPVASAGHVPVDVLDAELARPLPSPDPRRPAEVLVRVHGRPLGTVRVEARGSLVATVTEQLGDAVAKHLADDGLSPTGEPPGVPAQEPPWPCHRAAAPTRSTSVVIPTVGRPRYVVDLVRSLLDGDVAPDEVIVVDNRPANPATAEALDSAFADEPRVRYLAEPVAGASLARNTGLRAARSDLVAFLDDDVVADRAWLASVHEAWDADAGGRRRHRADPAHRAGDARPAARAGLRRLRQGVHPPRLRPRRAPAGPSALPLPGGRLRLRGERRVRPRGPHRARRLRHPAGPGHTDQGRRGSRRAAAHGARRARDRLRTRGAGAPPPPPGRRRAPGDGLRLRHRAQRAVRQAPGDGPAVAAGDRPAPAGRPAPATCSRLHPQREPPGGPLPPELTVRELLGIAAGPLAFARSARRVRK